MLPVELDEELHRPTKHAAIDEGLKLHDCLLKRLDEKTGIEGKNGNNSRKRKNKDDSHHPH